MCSETDLKVRSAASQTGCSPLGIDQHNICCFGNKGAKWSLSQMLLLCSETLTKTYSSTLLSLAARAKAVASLNEKRPVEVSDSFAERLFKSTTIILFCVKDTFFCNYVRVEICSAKVLATIKPDVHLTPRLGLFYLRQ